MNVVVNIDFESTVPLYKQLFLGLREAIQTGRFKTGDRMPPTRELAKQLGLSRVTVLRCYRDLLGRGYLEAGHGLGTRVARNLPDELRSMRRQMLSFDPETSRKNTVDVSAFTERVNRPAPASQSSLAPDFDSTLQHELPLRQWRQSLMRCARDLDPSKFNEEVETFGYRPLRESIASLFGRTRAIRCTADQVIVCNGSNGALDLIARVLINEGDVVAVENPGSIQTRDLYAAHGADLLPIPVDEQGLEVDALSAHQERIKLLHVTPSHHNPTGAVMPASRRVDLLHWARNSGTMIVEDDYDCAFRFGGQALPAIQGFDETDSVIYHADFRKLLFPLVNVSFIVVPESLIDAFTNAKRILNDSCPMVENVALTDFISGGQFEMHVRAIRDTLLTRRQALMYSLAINFRRLVSFGKETTGTHMIVRFHDRYLTEEEYAECARMADLEIIETKPCYMSDPTPREFLVPFAFAEPEVLNHKIGQLAGNIAAHAVTTPPLSLVDEEELEFAPDTDAIEEPASTQFEECVGTKFEERVGTSFEEPASTTDIVTTHDLDVTVYTP